MRRNLAPSVLICCLAGGFFPGVAAGADWLSQLISQLKSRHEESRRDAADSLGLIGDPRAVEPLIAALQDSSVDVNAANALGEIGDPRAVGPLCAALKSPDFDLRASAASALGEIGAPSAMEPLRAALTDSILNVRISADIAIETIKKVMALQEAGESDNPVSKATIYVYRVGRIGGTKHPLVHVQGEVLSYSLYPSSYVLGRVRQGSIVITASAPYNNSVEAEDAFPTNNTWKALDGCERLNLRRIFMGEPLELLQEDEAKCGSSLSEAMGEMKHASPDNLPGDIVNLCHLRVTSISHTANPEVIGFNPADWNQCFHDLSAALAILQKNIQPLRIEIEAKAGMTYYVRWSVDSGGKIELVDGSIGAREILGLQPATSPP